MRGQGESGFTLMEVLVAFAIFSLSIIAVLQSYASSSRSKARSHASMDAGRLLSRLVSSVEARLDGPGSVSGVEGGLQWTLEVSPLSDNLLEIEAVVTDAFGRRQSAETMRWRAEIFPESVR